MLGTGCDADDRARTREALTMAKRKRRSRGSLGFFIVFGLFWTAIVGVFDAWIGYNMYRQSQAESFLTCEGIIRQAEMTTHSDSDGTTYGVDLEFTYTVDGRPYIGNRYRYGSFSTSDHGYIRSVLDRYSPGTTVIVRYDPANPKDSVLEVGVGSTEMMLLLFLTPFNLVMLWLWMAIGGGIRRRITNPPAGGVPITRRGMNVHVRLPRYSPLTAAGAVALGISFVSIFPVIFTTGMDPPMWVIWTVWIGALASSLAVYFWRTFVVGSGAKDLVIDTETNMLSLPRTFGRKTDIIAPIEAVREIDVKVIAHRGSKGGTIYTYAPRLHWTNEDGRHHTEKLADWHDNRRADRFAEWLREQLGLDSAGIAE
jgi:hypothetical protein